MRRALACSLAVLFPLPAPAAADHVTASPHVSARLGDRISDNAWGVIIDWSINCSGPAPGNANYTPAGPCAVRRAGTPRGDALTGTAAGDLILGLGGNDVLRGLGGADCLVGGAGGDLLVGGSGGDRLSGGAGGDRLSGGA